jgi:ADP-ribosylglycohydrolase
MLGAIVGDIIGSPYEFSNIKTKEFPLFAGANRFTDDTVMTVAIACGILNGATEEAFISSMRQWGNLYPKAGYGQRFARWLGSASPMPYDSWGNGTAMRVSPCVEYVYAKMLKRYGDEAGDNQAGRDDIAFAIEKARFLARVSASASHRHPEAVKGAEAVAYAQMTCFLYDEQLAKKRIMEDIQLLFGYDLSQTLDEIRPNYMVGQPSSVKESCQHTVPQAIIAFVESTCFEDAIRNAVSLGGDSDTLAAITGSIAEAAYGIPSEIRQQALVFLDEQLREAMEQWESKVQIPAGNLRMFPSAK